MKGLLKTRFYENRNDWKNKVKRLGGLHTALAIAVFCGTITGSGSTLPILFEGTLTDIFKWIAFSFSVLALIATAFMSGFNLNERTKTYEKTLVELDQYGSKYENAEIDDKVLGDKIDELIKVNNGISKFIAGKIIPKKK